MQRNYNSQYLFIKLLKSDRVQKFLAQPKREWMSHEIYAIHSTVQHTLFLRLPSHVKAGWASSGVDCSQDHGVHNTTPDFLVLHCCPQVPLINACIPWDDTREL